MKREILLLSVLVLVMGVNVSQGFENTVVRQTHQYLMAIAQGEAIHIEAFIHDVQGQLRMLALNPQIKEGTAHSHSRSLKNISTTDEYAPEKIVFEHFKGRINALCRIDATGIVQSRVPWKDRVGADYSQKPGVKAVMKNHQPYVSKLFTTNSGQKAISVRVPVFKDKEFVGILRAVIHLDAIQDCLEDTKFSPKNYAWIIDDSGTIISHHDPGHIGRDAIALRKALFPHDDCPRRENVVAKMTNGEKGISICYPAWSLNEYSQSATELTAFAPIKIGNRLWSTSVSMDYNEISNPVKAHTKYVFVAAGFLILIFAGASVGFYKVYKKKVLLEMQAKSAEQPKAINQQLESETAERKEAEQKLEAVNHYLMLAARKLEESNRTLQDFVYIASHDLREPLRKINSFGELLKDSLGGNLGEDDQENLDFMIDGTHRMEEMVDGILAYSRVGTKGLSFEAVDLSEIVEQLEQVELAELLEETSGTIEIQKPLPKVEADSPGMRQLLQNLIANGIKYRRDEVQPRIAIRAKQIDNDKVRIEVRDNGIGIKQEDYNDIFTMFSRLHSRQKYEGTGIGLAVCKKIMERHNGQIGVESKYGEGSTFWFIISVAKQ